MNFVRYFCTILGWSISFCSANAFCQRQELEWKVQVPDASISLRGLCVVDAKVAWACGSKGAVLRTEDGGKLWQSVSPVGFSKLEFRSIHAWSRDVACIASAGTPAVLLRTQDGGKSWQETFRHPSENAFFDSMQFWNDREGVAVSDPVDGRWVVLNTNDRGQSWSNRLGGDIRAPGKEAAFAASNGSLFAASGKEIWLGTGGEVEGAKAAVYLLRPDKTLRMVTPIRSHASAGIFAVDVSEEGRVVVVGGDYQKVDQVDSTAAWSHDGGQTWYEAEIPPSGFRSSVVRATINGVSQYFAAGPNGVDQSLDGKNWKPVSTIGFHAIRWEKTSSTLWAVGSDGRIAQTIVRR